MVQQEEQLNINSWVTTAWSKIVTEHKLPVEAVKETETRKIFSGDELNCCSTCLTKNGKSLVILKMCYWVYVLRGLSCPSWIFEGKQFLLDRDIIWYHEVSVKYLKNLAEQQSSCNKETGRVNELWSLEVFVYHRN